METANVEAQHELALLRSLVSDLNFRLKEATEMSKKERLRANKMEAASLAASEDWRVELEAMEQQHDTEMSRLKRANDQVRLELVAANRTKDEALRLARDAMVAGEIAAQRANFLSSELEKAMAAVEMVRQAGVAMVAKKESELRQQVAACFQAKQQLEVLQWELVESRQKEMKLSEMENGLQILREQLANSREREHHLAKVVLDVKAKLEEASFEMHRAKTVESEATSLLSLARAEAAEMRERWKTARAETCSLMENLKLVTHKLITSQEELLRLQERESFACAQAANAEAMLLEAREGMARAIAREESKDHTVKKLTCMLDEAKLVPEMLRQRVFEVAFEAEFGVAESIVRAIDSEENKDCLVNEARLEADVLRQQIYVAAFEAQVEGQDLQNDLEASKAISGRRGTEVVAMRGLLESRDNVVTELMALLADAKLEGQMLRQQTYEAIFEAHLGAQRSMEENEADIEQEVMLIHTVLLDAVMGKAQAHGEALDELTPPPLAKEVEANSVNNGCGLLQVRHSDRSRALGVCLATANKVTSELHGAREQLEVLRDEEAEERINLDMEQKLQLAKTGEEKMQVKSPELSEPWEMVESGFEEVGSMVTIKQEECDVFKRKKLEEFKCLLLEMEPQSLGAAEVGSPKGIIEGERLWKASLEKGHVGSSASQSPERPFRLALGERKLQHYSLSNSLYSVSSVSHKEEESAEFLSLSLAKKKTKKKPLFLRIGAFLTKQKRSDSSASPWETMQRF